MKKSFKVMKVSTNMKKETNKKNMIMILFVIIVSINCLFTIATIPTSLCVIKQFVWQTSVLELLIYIIVFYLFSNMKFYQLDNRIRLFLAITVFSVLIYTLINGINRQYAARMCIPDLFLLVTPILFAMIFECYNEEKRNKTFTIIVCISLIIIVSVMKKSYIPVFYLAFVASLAMYLLKKAFNKYIIIAFTLIGIVVPLIIVAICFCHQMLPAGVYTYLENESYFHNVMDSSRLVGRSEIALSYVTNKPESKIFGELMFSYVMANTGLISAIVLILPIIAFAIYLSFLAFRIKDPLLSSVIVCIVAILVTCSMYNVLMNFGLLPNVRIYLPFSSISLSFNISMSALVGMALSAYKQDKNDKE